MLSPHPPTMRPHPPVVPPVHRPTMPGGDAFMRIGWVLATVGRELVAPLTLINIILGVLLWGIGLIPEATATVLVVTVNVCITALQLGRAQYTLYRMQQAFQAPVSVWRDSATAEVAPRDVVVGDVVLLRPGERVPADCEVLEAAGLWVDMSARTGESEPQLVTAGMHISHGCTIRAGAAWVVCVQPPPSVPIVARLPSRPLGSASLRLQTVVRGAAIGAGVLALFTVAAAVVNGQHWSAVLPAITVVVGLIPNALVLFATVTHATAAAALTRNGFIVNRQAAIETFAAVDTICFDKTGTLTTNQLIVDAVVPLHGSHDACVDILGGFVAADGAGNQSSAAIARAFPRVALPFTSSQAFESARKWSSLTDATRTLVLGAPDVLIPTLSPKWQRETTRATQHNARVLLLIEGDSEWNLDARTAEPICGVVLHDHIRPGAAAFVARCVADGIRVCVLSGDDPAFVAHVATQVGIPIEGVVHGNALDGQRVPEIVRTANIIGRMLPQHKEVVVRTLQAQAGCVAFVGDGFNDVAALRRADVAIAFSAAHAVVRDSADVVLVVDDLAALNAMTRAGQRVHATLTQIGNHVLWRVIVCAVVWVGTVCTQTPTWTPLDSTAIALLGVALPNLSYMFVPHRGTLVQRDRRTILVALGVGVLFVAGWWLAVTLVGLSDVRWLTAAVIIALWVRVWFTRQTQ